jgi:signal transduction histidine kinase
MRTPIQSRLALTTLFVLLLGMGLAAGLTWLTVEQLFLNTQRENLLAQARLTASALYDSPLPSTPSEPYFQSSNIAPGIHTRLLAEDAVVVSLPLTDSSGVMQMPAVENAEAVAPEELLGRSEIQAALMGDPATAVRRVASAGNRRVLYAAAPIFSAEGKVTGLIYLATPLPPASLPSDVILKLAAAVLAAILLAGAAGALLSRRIARPLEAFARAASRVADGDLDQRVPVDSPIRELHSLGNAFNEMTARLKQSDQMKNAFIADVTHELRTPLTVINGTIETLEDGALDDLEGRGPLMASMQRETKRLIRLVNDLLVLARADANALNLNVEALDLEQLARDRCAALSLSATTRKISFKIEAQARVEACGDTDRVVQVLDNLLDNAIRHAPEGSAVTVSIEKDGVEVKCTVSDNGPGIPPQHLPFIFERFYRAEGARKRHSGGTGLGLAIVHSLVQAQGGRVSAESTEGQGTAVSFWLPERRVR